MNSACALISAVATYFEVLSIATVVSKHFTKKSLQAAAKAGKAIHGINTTNEAMKYSAGFLIAASADLLQDWGCAGIDAFMESTDK